MTERKAVQEHAQMLIYRDARPKLMGPGVKFSGQMIFCQRRLSEMYLAENGDAITPIECNGTDLNIRLELTGAGH